MELDHRKGIGKGQQQLPPPITWRCTLHPCVKGRGNEGLQPYTKKNFLYMIYHI